MSTSIDLHQLSTARTQEKAIAGITSGYIKLNETVTWEAVHFGIKQRLTSIITAWERPFHFRDEQLKGVFKRFQHDHYFEQQGEWVILRDRFEFESPLGILGKVFNRLVLTRYLTRFLKERNDMIKAYAESGEWKKLADDQ